MTDLDITKTSTDSPSDDARALWQTVWGFPNAISQQDLTEWIDEFGDTLVCWAIQYAARRDVQPRAANKYLDRVLTHYRDAGVTTVEQAEAEAKQHEQVARAAAPRPRYGKPARVEKAPDWLGKGYTPPEAPPDEQQQADIDAGLATLREMEGDNANANA
nr:DnaD domain protein [Lacticaseibacillus absianus]